MGHLTVTGLGKAYKRYPSKAARLKEWLGMGTRHELHWVLHDIQFAIQPGEAVGIIGINGAGKSTLLKIIAGVLSPTTGSVQVGGRVAALLELGMGFQAEFTGRQNVQMSGLLAGMTADELQHKMLEIEQFADIGDYIDQPVRTYSSGMQVRLAFSVATAVRPDVLIVDEALAVGDIFFQQKCFERIRSFISQGTTLLFVSHALSTVYTLCTRAILIDAGRIALDGEPRHAIDLYNGLVAARSGTGQHTLQVAAPQDGQASPDGPTPGSYGNEGVTIQSVQLLHNDSPAHSVVSGSTLTAQVLVGFGRHLPDPHIGFQVRDRRGEAIFMTHTHAMGLSLGAVQPHDAVNVTFQFQVPLIAGDYTLTIGVANGGLPGGALADSLARQQDAWAFQVVANLDDIHWNGLCHLHPSATVQRQPALSADAVSLPPVSTGQVAVHPHQVLVTTSNSLLLFNLTTGQAQPLHRGAGLYYGMAITPEHLLVAARQRLVSASQPQDQEQGAILVFNHSLQHIDTWHAPFPLRDIHEIAFHQGTLFVTCSFDNMVALRHPGGHWQQWYPLGEPDGPHRDVNHFNSLAFTPGLVHLLAHNRGPSQRMAFHWPSQQHAHTQPLGHQAHNLWWAGGQWHTCSSAQGTVVSAAHTPDQPEAPPATLATTGGFPRGVAAVGGQFVVGVSELAERAQRDLSTGVLHMFSPTWQLLHTWPLVGEGLVLDIKPCPIGPPSRTHNPA